MFFWNVGRNCRKHEEWRWKSEEGIWIFFVTYATLYLVKSPKTSPWHISGSSFPELIILYKVAERWGTKRRRKKKDGRVMEAVWVGTRPISELELRRSQRESSRSLRKVATLPFTQPGRHTYTEARDSHRPVLLIHTCTHTCAHARAERSKFMG